MTKKGEKKRFAVGTQVRIVMPGVNGTVTEVDEAATVLAEYWHKVKTEHGERREPGSNLELVPTTIGSHMDEKHSGAKLAPGVAARKSKLLEQLHSLETLSLCSPSDDPEEQTSVIETYRYILINIKLLSKGIVSSETQKQLGEQLPETIESIYDVYFSKAHLDAIAFDIASDLENIGELPEPGSPRHLISPDLIKALKEAKPNAFDALRLAEYCREINSGFNHGNLISCLLLMRAVLNHVPPVFGHTDFSQVVAHASRSLKDNFEHLDESLRKIGDLYTHQHMRKKDHLPTSGQVEKFGPQFELLLQEVLTRL